MARVGVVLAGGFAKGAYHIGVLKAFKNHFSNNEIICISSSSIGGLNGYAYIVDKLDDLEKSWLNLEFKNTRTFVRKYLKSAYFESIINNFTDSELTSQTNLYINCLNCSKRQMEYINLQNISKDERKKYLRASIALPMFTPAVKINNQKYIDGGIIDIIPVKPLLKYQLDYIFVIHFDNNNFIFESKEFDNKVIKLQFLDDKFFSSFAFDKESVRKMIEMGYNETDKLFKNIFKDGKDNLEKIYEEIKIHNELKDNRQLRLSVDIGIGMINKTLSKIFKKTNEDKNE